MQETYFKKHIKKVRKLSIIMILSMGGWMLIMSFLFYGSTRKETSLNYDIFLMLLSIFFPIIFHFVIKNVQKKDVFNKDIGEKIQHYQRIVIMKYASIFSGILICFIGYQITLNNVLLVILGAFLVFLIKFFPSRKTFIKDLQLSIEEQKSLDLEYQDK